ncbi:MAG: Type 1 glutamine amidotransferase-like domain-containing protein [Verrucomicrobiota bacterium]|nr:Type 1 glutamine amidotransferase-like domain-containing protein [Verrucomicrobiota bacterium]
MRIFAAIFCLCFGVAAKPDEVTSGPPKGTLVIVGGNDKDQLCFKKFIKLAGGKKARIVIVTTASSSNRDFDYVNHSQVKMAREKLGLTKVAALHTHDRAKADTKEFVEPLQKADAVWFTGGRQWRLVDAYAGTRTEKTFNEVLARGGVVGGSSAGATIQGTYLMRGDTNGSSILFGDHQHGFAFLRNAAIDQHIIPRFRHLDLIKVLTDPEEKMDKKHNREALLGIGLDEGTGIVVRQNECEVIGKPTGVVLIYDPTRWKTDTKPHAHYQPLWHGARYDLKRRKILKPGIPPLPKSTHRAEGFYKDIFMDGGVNLSSRRNLPAAESLGLSYELYAGRNPDKQSELIIGSPQDENGVLLYPDGQPRFRLIYVNGGGATAHGKSLELPGRKVFRQFFNKGGSYSGSCAGSFLSGRNTNKSTPRRLGYLHIFPYNTLTTGIKKTRIGHVIPHNSPLLKYRDFGGDYYVPEVYHNNGNWLSQDLLKEMKHVEVLATYDHPKHKVHEGAAIWAYKKEKGTGRVINIGSHPEGTTSGERLELTESCFRYALDGIGNPPLKARLENGVTRHMNKRTSDNVPELTRIGDLQYHHFDFEVRDAPTDALIELTGQKGFDFCLYLKKGAPAFRSNADHAATKPESTKAIKTKLTPGRWFVSIECTTTVKATLDGCRGFFNYIENTAVLNGAAYKIKLKIGD